MAQAKTIQQHTNVREILEGVYEEINWASLAKKYFGKSRSWLYHKFSGRTMVLMMTLVTKTVTS